ncbi:MAG: CoA transferase, partial [Chloroflexi bacterium]|nr:CoA transferase [Chloroflexota bacterium]
RRDELELVFRAWAAERTPQQAATTLQAHGIPAAPAYHIDEMLNDPHVRERGLILKDAHRYTKGRHIAALPFDFGATLRPAPCWAEHNDDLFGGLLGLRHNEVERLTRDGVLA